MKSKIKKIFVKAAALGIMSVMCIQLAGCDSKAQQQGNTQSETSAEETSVSEAQDSENTSDKTDENISSEKETEVFDIERANTENYKLKEVVILSRHNIRAPLSSNGSINEIATPHEWFKWTGKSSELSLKGGILETEMGQYFRKWLEDEELIPENYIPAGNETRFYANSKQRTLATAQYFSSGMLPAANVDIEHYAEIGKMDETFNPKLHFISDDYKTAALEQINEISGEKGIVSSTEKLDYDLLSDVMDYKDSQGYKSGELKDFKTDDTEIILEDDKEPNMKGSLKTACQLSDALVLQYYEEPDAKKAAFGKDLTYADWAKIANIVSTYGHVLQSAPLISLNIANPLVKELKGELDNNERKFSFLCGHDVNITSVLSSLEAEDYELPYTLETKVPIGSKVVFEKWVDSEGKEYMAIELVYQSTEQLRSNAMLGLDNPPVMYPLSFKGIEKNADGLYNFADIDARFEKALDEYNNIKEKYSGSNEHKAAA